MKLIPGKLYKVDMRSHCFPAIPPGRGYRIYRPVVLLVRTGPSIFCHDGGLANVRSDDILLYLGRYPVMSLPPGNDKADIFLLDRKHITLHSGSVYEAKEKNE